MKCLFIFQIALIGVLVLVVGVLSYNGEEHPDDVIAGIPKDGDVSEAAVNVDEKSPHHSRSKRSPADPVLASLLIAKSFILGGLLGSTLGRHHGHGGGWRRVQRSHIPHYAVGWQSGPPPQSYGGWGWNK